MPTKYPNLTNINLKFQTGPEPSIRVSTSQKYGILVPQCNT